MARAQCRLLFIAIAVFIGLYFINHNYYFGQWQLLGNIGWMKWLLFGLAMWVVFGALSSRPRRRDRGYSRDHDWGHRDRDLHAKINALQDELTDLRRRRVQNERSNTHSEVDTKLAALTERIENLEKIVTDRRYQLDEKISQL